MIIILHSLHNIFVLFTLLSFFLFFLLLLSLFYFKKCRRVVSVFVVVRCLRYWSWSCRLPLIRFPVFLHYALGANHSFLVGWPPWWTSGLIVACFGKLWCEVSLVSTRSIAVLGTFVLYTTVLLYYIFRFCYFAPFLFVCFLLFVFFLNFLFNFTDRVQRYVILCGQFS